MTKRATAKGAAAKRIAAKRAARVGAATKREPTPRKVATQRKPAPRKVATQRKPAPRRLARKRTTAAVEPRAAAPTKRRTNAAPRAAAPARRRAPRAPRHRTPLAITPAFAPQRSQASLKQRLLFDLERGRVAVHAAIQGMSGGHTDMPIAPGKWSPRQLVLHLAFWDQFILNAIPFALHQNEAPNWEAMDFDAVNAQGLELHAEADWEEARRILDRTREELRAALERIPAEPQQVWTPAHALGTLLAGYDHHDRHHAAQIKAFRIARGSA